MPGFPSGEPSQPPPPPPWAQHPPGPPGVGSVPDDSDVEGLSYNKRSMQKWEKDEALGENATISPVLYANLKHPELKTQYRGQSCQQILYLVIVQLLKRNCMCDLEGCPSQMIVSCL